MKKLIATIVAVAALGDAASANVRITNTTGNELIVEIRSESLRPQKYTLARTAVNADFGSYGNTPVILRLPDDPENEVCRGLYDSGTVLILEKKVDRYVLSKVIHPQEPR
jgi:hypothetical protein